MDLLKNIRARAKGYNKRIVLPEALEERTLKAADELLREEIVRIILLGNPDSVRKEAEKLGLEHIEKARVVDPLDHEKKGGLRGPDGGTAQA